MSEIAEFERILRDLVRFKTVTINRRECQECADYIASLLESLGFRVEVFCEGEMNPVIFAELAGRERRSLVFYNHYDVQPAEPLDAWTVEPFELTKRGELLFGRGVSDNKGNIVARIVAVKSALDKLGELPYTVKFVIEGEEEAGSPNLRRALRAKRDFFSDAFGVLWEFGGFNPDGSLTLTLGLKGIVYAELRVRRLKRDAHSSLECVLPSAVWDLLIFLTRLKLSDCWDIPSFYDGMIDARKVIEEIRKAGLRVHFDARTLKEVYGVREFARGMSDEDAMVAYYGRPAFNVDGIIAGYTGPGQKTVLPAEAVAKVDFRLVPFQRTANVMRGLKALAERHGIEVKFYSATEPAYTDFRHPFVQWLIARLKDVGQEFDVAPWSPASGPMHLFRELGLACVAGIGVSYWDSRAHAPDENIRLEDVRRTIDLLKHLLSYPPPSA